MIELGILDRTIEMAEGHMVNASNIHFEKLMGTCCRCLWGMILEKLVFDERIFILPPSQLIGLNIFPKAVSVIPL